MSSPVSDKFSLCIQHGKIAECIKDLEEAMTWLRTTPYHEIIGKTFMGNVVTAADAIVDLYLNKSKGTAKALYFEMNGFSINTDCWYFNGFGYEKGGTLWDLTWEHEWACYWQYETDSIVLAGMEAVQLAFGSLYGSKSPGLGYDMVGEIAEHLVVARFNELIDSAHEIAKQKCPLLIDIPVLSTAHDWDRFCPST